MKINFFSRSLVLLFTLNFSFISSANSEQSPFSCTEPLKIILVEKNPLINIGPFGRFFLKNTPPDDPKRLLSGFLTEYKAPDKKPNFYETYVLDLFQHPFRKFTRAITGTAYDAAPFMGFYYNFAQRLPRALTRYKFGKPLDLKTPFALPLGMTPVFVAGAYAYDAWDWSANNALLDRQIALIEENFEDWDNLINFDIRFQSLKNLRNSSQISPEIARQKAFLLKKKLEAYFIIRHQQIEQNLSDTEALPHYLDFEFFADLKNFSEKGVPENKSSYIYQKDFLPGLSLDQISELSQIKHEEMAFLQLVWDWTTALDPSDLEPFLNSAPTLKHKFEIFRSSSFVKDLLEICNSKQLNRFQVAGFLQQEISWQFRFKQQQILKIYRKFRDSMGQLTDQALTLEDIHKELLQEVKSK